MNEKIKYWLELAEYDLETAGAMLKTKRYLYVGLMCHQAVEKVLKGYWHKIQQNIPPKTHNLNYLCNRIGLDNDLNEKFSDFIDEIEPLNIQTRYPEYKEALFKKMNQEYCERIYKNTKELFSWIKEKLF